MKLSIKDIQKMELDMLIELHEFMKKHQLRYYLIGGSMLGAIRHKGFIPWDDDIDIGMPRVDFERLLLLSEKLPEPLQLKFFRNNELYIYNFAKIENKNTILIETDIKHLNIKSGIYIDIFPIDGVPNNKIIRKIHLIKIKLLFLLRNICCADSKKKRRLLKQSMVILIQNIFSFKFIIKELDKHMRKYSFEESKIIANYSGSWGEREIMPKSYMGDPVLYKFEKYNFFGVAQPDKYLKNVYGNYMELPEEEKRTSHHNFEVKIIKEID